MGFFDTFGETVTNTGRALGSKTREVAESTKISFQIQQEEIRLKDAYAALGEAYYRANMSAIPEEYEKYAADIRTSLGKLDKLTLDKQVATNKKRCTKCGAWMPREDLFCGKCGAINEVMEETEKEAEKEADTSSEETVNESSGETDPSAKVCPKCGAVTKLNLLYCPECGEKL